MVDVSNIVGFEDDDLVRALLKDWAWAIEGELRTRRPVPAKIEAVDKRETVLEAGWVEVGVTNLINLESAAVEDRLKANLELGELELINVRQWQSVHCPAGDGLAVDSDLAADTLSVDVVLGHVDTTEVLDEQLELAGRDLDIMEPVPLDDVDEFAINVDADTVADLLELQSTTSGFGLVQNEAVVVIELLEHHRSVILLLRHGNHVHGIEEANSLLKSDVAVRQLGRVLNIVGRNVTPILLDNFKNLLPLPGSVTCLAERRIVIIRRRIRLVRVGVSTSIKAEVRTAVVHVDVDGRVQFEDLVEVVGDLLGADSVVVLAPVVNPARVILRVNKRTSSFVALPLALERHLRVSASREIDSRERQLRTGTALHHPVVVRIRGEQDHVVTDLVLHDLADLGKVRLIACEPAVLVLNLDRDDRAAVLAFAKTFDFLKVKQRQH